MDSPLNHPHQSSDPAALLAAVATTLAGATAALSGWLDQVARDLAAIGTFLGGVAAIGALLRMIWLDRNQNRKS